MVTGAEALYRGILISVGSLARISDVSAPLYWVVPLVSTIFRLKTRAGPAGTGVSVMLLRGMVLRMVTMSLAWIISRPLASSIAAMSGGILTDTLARPVLWVWGWVGWLTWVEQPIMVNSRARMMIEYFIEGLLLYA